MGAGGAPLALTMGEPSGIGGELALMAWAARRDRSVPAFVLLDDPARIEALGRLVGLQVPVARVGDPAEAVAAFDHALPILPVPLDHAVVPGKPDPENGAAVLASIERAVMLVQAGACSAMVTNPIQKSALYQAGFGYPGHTEYLAALAGMVTEPVMMLAGGGLRVVPVTIHLPLRDAIDALTTQGIVQCARVTAAALSADFGIEEPRLALAALNPHAGENGTLGTEEIEIITPAATVLKREGYDVIGPLPADTLFHAAARRRYDAVLCMYHDQALIPLKTVDFDTGVNITLGLPFVRTSPDHGTALDIAGTGKADPASLIAALKTAVEMAGYRAARRYVPERRGR
ncbi:4-hydroxythreonine-4-phosphate dehydrogenase PdxA [Skermanella rosea]|uniref:4-hydroxythreonine-4-phosphate dehydrogenase PdxA n=1 Tax=Skermanella rosea TaxID=1817965 RepID=UPI00193441CD|nr:4-hydroxythreonine-4-phosphate dehydrogenase PdxA [Skermanella rosea]UEM05271.1 4-hydroxythreonine-4-phosphate dehydrogenase PdxA [Skermanella rosea]